jgi:hypothetical protein
MQSKNKKAVKNTLSSSFQFATQWSLPNLISWSDLAGCPSVLNLRDRCYDFLNIFADKLGQKIGVFYSKQS